MLLKGPRSIIVVYVHLSFSTPPTFPNCLRRVVRSTKEVTRIHQSRAVNFRAKLSSLQANCKLKRKRYL